MPRLKFCTDYGKFNDATHRRCNTHLFTENSSNLRNADRHVIISGKIVVFLILLPSRHFPSDTTTSISMDRLGPQKAAEVFEKVSPHMKSTTSDLPVDRSDPWSLTG